MTARDQFDTLAPEFKVKVNGQALPADALADMIGLTVLDDVDAASMFTLSLSGWDAAQMKPKWMDDALFREGNAVEIGIGYRDDTPPLAAGEITGIEPEFLLGKGPTLTLRGHDRRHRLMRSRRTRTFTNCKDSDIASRIASEAGLKPDTEDSRLMMAYVLQHNQTDLEFLMTRAQRIGWELLVHDRTLLFRPRKAGESEVLTLRREVELLEFRARLSTLGQVPELEVRGWDAGDKKEIVGRASVGDESRLMNGKDSGPSAVRRAFSTEASARVTQPVQDQAEADQLAQRGFVEMALHHVHAQGLCIGEPRLKAGSVVKIEGLGERFSGLYYITSTEHRFGKRNGFRTSFSARRNAT
jgi:phage protein D